MKKIFFCSFLCLFILVPNAFARYVILDLDTYTYHTPGCLEISHVTRFQTGDSESLGGVPCVFCNPETPAEPHLWWQRPLPSSRHHDQQYETKSYSERVPFYQPNAPDSIEILFAQPWK